MNPKALLVIGPEPPPITGMELVTQALIAELRRVGIPYVRVDTADPTDELGNRGRWTMRNVAFALRHLATAVRKSRDDDLGAIYVPIAQEFPALLRDIAFLLVGRTARLPVIVHLHGGTFATFYASRARPVRFLLKATVGKAALGIVLTERLRPALECVLPSERVSVVPNGIEVPDDINRRLPMGNVIHVLFLSSLFRWKGPFTFIRAFALAHEKRPDIRGTVAGDWPTEDIRLDALNLARELGVEKQLAFTGAVDGVVKIDLFRRANVFCFASLVPEGQPLVILEAMAAQLPVIAPAWPGIADTVVDGETGLLVAEATPGSLAEKLLYLVDRPEERHRLGVAARERYERLYTQRQFGDRIVEVLRPFLQGADVETSPAREKAVG